MVYSTLGLLAGSFEAIATGSPSSHSCYVACFCRGKGDLLSQWRGYAEGSRGHAIGFRRAELETFGVVDAGPGLTTTTCDVRYGEHAIIDRLREISVVPTDGGLDLDRFQAALHLLLSAKHKAFRAEREFRMVAVDLAFPKNLGFRTGPNGLVPYMDASIPNTAIAEIVVGPGLESPALRAVEQLLRTHIEDQEVAASVQVRGSKVPFR
jgi:hypothetical protein